MPELPEVETIRRDLAQKIIGHTIASVDVLVPKVVRLPVAALQKKLVGRKFMAIDRIGKLLILTLDALDQYMLLHLKMTGQLIYRDAKTIIAGGHSLTKQKLEALPDAHTRVIFHFKNKSTLFFNDLRLFGYLQLVTKKELDAVKKNYGIEPLTRNFTLNNFSARLKNKKTTIKALLLNQKKIAGIGNIYADEACFLSGIHPQRALYTLTAAEIKKLFLAIEKVLSLSLKHRGTTFNSFLDTDGNIGNFSSFLKVYGRGGDRCLVCKKALITKIKVAGRGTHFCPVCQS